MDNKKFGLLLGNLLNGFNDDIKLLKIGVVFLFCTNFIMAVACIGTFVGLHNLIDDIMATKTVSQEINQVWGIAPKVYELTEIPTEELK